MVGLFRWRPVPPPQFTPRSERLVITVAVGADAEACHTVTEPSQRAYADRLGADYVVIRWPTQSWGMGEKFRVHAYAERYARTLFLDADVLVRPTCPDLFAACPAGGLWAADDLPHVTESMRPGLVRQGYDVHASYGVDVPPGWPAHCWNTGVVLGDRELAHVWAPPTARLVTAHCVEQWHVQLRAEWAGVPVRALPPEFHWQWWQDQREERRAASHIWHASGKAGPDKLPMLTRWASLSG